MSNTAHHDWVDSIADWAESHPITQRIHRAIPLTCCTQNCDQGRKCDCQPEPAEAATELGADAGDEFINADQVFWIYCMAGLAVWAVVITVWLAAS